MNELNRTYLNELKNEHKAVGRLLEDIKDFIQRNDVQGIVGSMDLLKNGLTAHITKEDNKMYADLLKTAKEKNMEAVSLSVDIFSKAMSGIAGRALEFFGKYPDKNAMLKRDAILKLTEEFSRDFSLVYEDLLKRVGHEERVLYPLYERHCC